MNALEAQLAAALVLMTAHQRSGPCAEQRVALARKVAAQIQALADQPRWSVAFRRVMECLASQWTEQVAAVPPTRWVMPAAPGIH